MIGRLFTYTTPDHFPSTVTGRPVVVRTADDLDRLIAQRRALDPASKGWLSRKAGA